MYVDTYTGIEMYLPAQGKDWKGVYSAHGCGVSCGVLGLDYVYGYGTGPYGAQLLERGYVANMTGMGYQNSDYAVSASSWNMLKGANNQQNSSLSDWTPFWNNRTVE
jgi:hypothetical protein